MRLIFGIVRFDGERVDPAALGAIARAMTPSPLSPRLATHIDTSAALGVLEFDASAPPPRVRLAEGGGLMAADIRLDRPLDLADSLGVDRTLDAEELALRALARWGEDLPDRMDGDFALAAWHPADRRLICARDVMGVRPLYYYHRPGELFAFASLPRGLHGSGVAPRDLDVPRLLQRLIAPAAGSGHTQFKQILCVPAAHSLTVTAGGARLHRAWRPDPASVGKWRGSRAEAAETLRKLIEEAVACRLPPAGPAACHFSGGLDSSAIAVIAARQLRKDGRRLHAYTMRSGSARSLEISDENRDHVAAVLAQERDIEWSPVHQSPFGDEEPFDEDIQQSGAGIGPENRICAAAARAGAQVLLSGVGGDEGASYHGRMIHRSLLLAGHWRTLRRELPRLAAREATPLWRVVAGIVLQLAPPSVGEWVARRRGNPGLRPFKQRLQVLGPAAVQQLMADPPIELKPGTSARHRIWLLTEGYLFGRIDQWSIIGARHGLAYSYPLLDRRVLEFALSLPLRMLVSGGYSRQPFRDAMAGILPDSVRWQTAQVVPYVDVAIKLAEAKPDLGFQVDALRRYPSIADLFDLDAIASGVNEAPDPHAAHDISTTARRPLEFRRGLAAYRAISAARYIARMTERAN